MLAWWVEIWQNGYYRSLNPNYSARWVTIQVVLSETIKENIDTMRIKRAKRSEERKAKIAPAEWQQFIESQSRKNKPFRGLFFIWFQL